MIMGVICLVFGIFSIVNVFYKEAIHPWFPAKALVSLSLWEGYHRAGEMGVQGCPVGLSTGGRYSTEDSFGRGLLAQGSGSDMKEEVAISLFFPLSETLGLLVGKGHRARG